MLGRPATFPRTKSFFFKEPEVAVHMNTELAEFPPGNVPARLVPVLEAQHHMMYSDEGHDGFLLEEKKVGTLLRGFLAEHV